MSRPAEHPVWYAVSALRECHYVVQAHRADEAAEFVFEMKWNHQTVFRSDPQRMDGEAFDAWLARGQWSRIPVVEQIPVQWLRLSFVQVDDSSS